MPFTPRFGTYFSIPLKRPSNETQHLEYYLEEGKANRKAQQGNKYQDNCEFIIPDEKNALIISGQDSIQQYNNDLLTIEAFAKAFKKDPHEIGQAYNKALLREARPMWSA